MKAASGPCRQVRVAAVTFSPRKSAIDENAKRLYHLFRRAAEAGAELAVGPEGALDGIVSMGVLTGEWPSSRALDAALTIDSEVIRRFQELALELSMCLAFGFAERISGEIYNAAVFIDDLGAVCGKYHKMVFGEGYHDSWWFNRVGHGSRAIHTPFGPCGFMICYDRWDPRAARIPVLGGATFLLVPAYGHRGDHNDRHVLARARENGVPVVQANGTGAAVVISGGEIVKKHLSPVENEDPGMVTMATIEVPCEGICDKRLRGELEREYIAWRDTHLKARFAERRSDYLEQWGGTRRASP